MRILQMQTCRMQRRTDYRQTNSSQAFYREKKKKEWGGWQRRSPRRQARRGWLTVTGHHTSTAAAAPPPPTFFAVVRLLQRQRQGQIQIAGAGGRTEDASPSAVRFRSVSGNPHAHPGRAAVRIRMHAQSIHRCRDGEMPRAARLQFFTVRR